MMTRGSLMLVLLFSVSGIALIAEGLSPLSSDGRADGLGRDITPLDDADRFPFAGAVPEDVFLYIAERPSAEREFVRQYWAEIHDAVISGGLGVEIAETLGALFGDLSPDDLAQSRGKIEALLSGVDWNKLGDVESAFIERFNPPADVFASKTPVMMPDMVLLLRGSGDSSSNNFRGLRKILFTVAGIIGEGDPNSAVQEMSAPDDGFESVSLDLLAGVNGAPRLAVTVARRGPVVAIALGDGLLGDVLSLLAGGGTKKTLMGNSRFRSAFSDLPLSSESITYFDMQGLLKPLDRHISGLFDTVTTPEDAYQSSKMSAEGQDLNEKAMVAYQQEEYPRALELIERAYETDPESSIVLYNLACFNALNGNKEKALDWLTKAVEGGFYAPRKIAGDSDFTSLRDEPAYQTALRRSAELARESQARDVVIHSNKTGEGYRLAQEASRCYQDGDLELALKSIEQARAVAPEDSRVLYDYSCYHSLLGHRELALDSLAKAVSGGFYCPEHISEDSDLDNIRKDPRFRVILADARRRSISETGSNGDGKAQLVQYIFNRAMSSAGIVDYTATVGHTSGASVWTDSVTSLVPGAEKNPIYKVIASTPQLARFDRFLPAETEAFSVTGMIDTKELFLFIGETLRSAGPAGEEVLEVLAQAQEQLGTNLKADSLDWIGDGFSEVTMREGGGSVWLVAVADEDAARAQIAATETFLSEKIPMLLSQIASENPMLGGLFALGIRFSPANHEQLEGFQNVHFAMIPTPLVFGIAEDHLFFGSSAEAIVTCLETARGEHPGIRENATIMKEAILPDGPFTGVTFTDRRGLGDQMAAGIGMVSMMSGMMSSMIPDPKVQPVMTKLSTLLSKIVPVVQKINFFRSEASRTTFDGRRWHTRKVMNYVPPKKTEKVEEY